MTPLPKAREILEIARHCRTDSISDRESFKKTEERISKRDLKTLVYALILAEYYCAASDQISVIFGAIYLAYANKINITKLVSGKRFYATIAFRAEYFAELAAKGMKCEADLETVADKYFEGYFLP
ncbi:hypothetical protein CO104_04590 [Candidatus Collierbacteria bacterium CG_4_9_14_3_um_filter_43_16]|uniref:Uncharacterized protein n=1 Tax=Candidatus Collierbacteria bacterium CG_4_9_14_3_um_filter_43_16 TaxID=1974532 RepID=A0A2M8BTN0_9BACT|nr:MAG: hypothetical protein CO104_04590 [Candidatus Collierbacteria bacterium CG_4_9_14_3_um_filter_43_16]